jgi:NTE family protein
VRLSGGGLIAGQEIVAFLRKLKISARIASYSRPFAAVATDLETGREIRLREGPIGEALRASIALPGIISPARHSDRWLVDGGLVNPVPVSLCRALGADVVIAVNLNGDERNSLIFMSGTPGFGMGC